MVETLKLQAFFVDFSTSVEVPEFKIIRFIGVEKSVERGVQGLEVISVVEFLQGGVFGVFPVTDGVVPVE